MNNPYVEFVEFKFHMNVFTVESASDVCARMCIVLS